MSLSLPERTKKNPVRTNGLSVCTDNGVSLRQFESFLREQGSYVDIITFSPGVVFLTKDILQDKVNMCNKFNVIPVCDGLVVEIYLVRKLINQYHDLCRMLGIDTHMVSDGSIKVPHHEKCDLIETLAKKNHTVYSKVGSKDAAHIIPSYKWIELMKAELESGSKYVFAESREAGNIGLYRGSGEPREGLILDILTQIPAEKIIWDAPQKSQQVYFIELLFQNCNLSRIKPEDLLRLESMRVGLDSSTFHLYLEEENKG